jgi:HSP20 family protein
MALVRRTQKGRGASTRGDLRVQNPECFYEDLESAAHWPWYGSTAARTMPAFSPRVDLVDNEREIILRADVPGVETEALDITITSGFVTIKGERRDFDLSGSDCLVCRESAFGAFERTIELPDQIRRDDATALLKNGVLVLTLPKAEPAPAVKVVVSSS